MTDAKTIVLVGRSIGDLNGETQKRSGINLSVDLDGGDDACVETQAASADDLPVDQQSTWVLSMTLQRAASRGFWLRHFEELKLLAPRIRE